MESTLIMPVCFGQLSWWPRRPQFPCPSDLPSDGHRCLKRILPGADSGPASSLFRASLCCCPAFTWEAAHRIYTAAFDSPSRLLPLSSSLFAAPSHSRSLPPALPLRPNRADGRGRGHHRPAPAQRRLPQGRSGSVRATLPRQGALPCRYGPRCCSQPNPNSAARLILCRPPFAGYAPPRARTGRSPCQSRPRRLRSLKGARPLLPWGLKAAPSSATSGQLHGCSAASSPKGSRARPCSSLLVIFPVPGSFHNRVVSFYL